MAKKAEKQEYIYASGKRKTAIARVRLYKKGTGEVKINGRLLDNFCTVRTQKGIILSPLKLTGTQKEFDVTVLVTGGGITAQAEAIRHGIAKALTVHSIELRPTLKQAGMLTRDSRIKERKKPGLKRARRAPQWCKR